MFFSVDRETLRWIQKTLSRARCSGNWPVLFAREACWTPQVFEALVDEHDRLLLEGRAALAEEIAGELPRLAGRVRASVCPGQELGRTSLAVWALAVHASSLRAAGRLESSEALFAKAHEKAKKGIFGWTRAELERRHAMLLLQRKDRRAFERLELAVQLFAEYPDQLAETLNARGACRAILGQDSSAAIQDFGLAAALSDPTRSDRSVWALQAALHNMAFQLVLGGPCTLEALGQTKKLLLSSRAYLSPGLDARKLRSLWVEGLLVYRIGLNRHGERLLERARQGFLKLGRSDEFAVASLDLVVLLTDDGEEKKARAVFAETVEILRQRTAESPNASASLQPNFEPGEIQLLRQSLVAHLQEGAPRLPGRGQIL